MELYYDFADYVSGKKEIPEKFLKMIQNVDLLIVKKFMIYIKNIFKVL